MTAPMRLPAAIQRLLHSIYDVAVHDVAPFLMTDAATARSLAATHAHEPACEALLLTQRGEELDLALFLDSAVLHRLAQQDPLASLHDDNLGDFLLVVEGISHFVYTVWNATHDRPLRLLDLELQAEIDKFVVALYLLRRQGHTGVSCDLHRSLFERVRYRAGLNREDLTRYRHANRYAGKYCRALRRRFPHRGRRCGLLTELRRFYRLGQQRKLRHIEQAAVPEPSAVSY